MRVQQAYSGALIEPPFLSPTRPLAMPDLRLRRNVHYDDLVSVTLRPCADVTGLVRHSWRERASLAEDTVLTLLPTHPTSLQDQLKIVAMCEPTGIMARLSALPKAKSERIARVFTYYTPQGDEISSEIQMRLSVYRHICKLCMAPSLGEQFLEQEDPAVTVGTTPRPVRQMRRRGSTGSMTGGGSPWRESDMVAEAENLVYESRQHLVTQGDPVERTIRQFANALESVDNTEIVPSVQDFVVYITE